MPAISAGLANGWFLKDGAVLRTGAWFVNEQGAALLLGAVGFPLFLLGRLLGSTIMRWAPAHRVLGVYALVNLVLCSLVVARLGWISACGRLPDLPVHVGHVPDDLRPGHPRPGRAGKKGLGLHRHVDRRRRPDAETDGPSRASVHQHGLQLPHADGLLRGDRDQTWFLPGRASAGLPPPPPDLSPHVLPPVPRPSGVSSGGARCSPRSPMVTQAVPVQRPRPPPSTPRPPATTPTPAPRAVPIRTLEHARDLVRPGPSIPNATGDIAIYLHRRRLPGWPGRWSWTRATPAPPGTM